MGFNARDLKNDDVGDAGFDLVMDNIAALSGDVGVTKILLGAKGVDGDVISATNPFPVEVIDVTNTMVADIGLIKTAVEIIDDIVLVEDVAHVTGDSGIMPLAVRNDVLAALAGTDGDYAPIQVNADGALYTEVVSVIPGTGATNLGKAIDSIVGSTDTGVALLAKHEGDTAHVTVTDGDYDIVRMSEFGALHVEPEQHHVIDQMDVTTGWAALGNDTLNLATTKKHVLGTDALTFDKVDGLANTVFGAIEKTFSSINLGGLSPHDIIQTVVFMSSVAAVDYVFVRLGTDSSNYNEWRIDGESLTGSVFLNLVFEIGDASHAGITGNGWDASAVTYGVVGVAFNAETDALSGIVFDELSFHTNQHVSASLNSEVTSSVNSANVNLQKINGSPTDKGAGNASNGSQRIVIATDDINQAAIKTSVEIIDDMIVVEDAAADADPSGSLGMSVRDDEVGSTAITDGDGDIQSLRSNKFGQLKTTQLPDATSEVKRVIINAASGDNTIVAAAGVGIKIRVLNVVCIAGGTTDCRFESNAAGTALTGIMKLVANSGFAPGYDPNGHFETADNELLNLECTGDLDGWLNYVEV